MIIFQPDAQILWIYYIFSYKKNEKKRLASEMKDQAPYADTVYSSVW